MKRYGNAAVLLIVLTLVLANVALSQERACGPFGGDHVVAWLVCSWEDTNDRVDAQERTIDALQRRIAALEAAQVSNADIEGIARSQADVRLQVWKQQSTAYTDRYLYDTLYNRLRIHVCRMGIPHNATVDCTGVK